MSYTKLANSILTSTVWMEDDHTRIVWLALLAMADRNGEVQASIPGLANIARVPIESCRAAIKKFLSPDADSRTKTDDGRRLAEIKGGWFLVNHPEYRKLASDEDRKQKAAERQQRFRDSNARNKTVTLPSRQIPQAEAEADSSSPSEKKGSDTFMDKEACLAWSSSKHCLEQAGKIYEAYPKRAGKPKALISIQKAISDFGFEFVMEKTVAYASARKYEDPQFTPLPATWFNQQRFNDDPSTWRNINGTNSNNRNAGLIGNKPIEEPRAVRVLRERALAAQKLEESAQSSMATQMAINGNDPS